MLWEACTYISCSASNFLEKAGPKLLLLSGLTQSVPTILNERMTITQNTKGRRTASKWYCWNCPVAGGQHRLFEARFWFHHPCTSLSFTGTHFYFTKKFLHPSLPFLRTSLFSDGSRKMRSPSPTTSISPLVGLRHDHTRQPGED